MWSVTRENLDKTRKVNVNFTIDKHLYEQFKRVAQKDMRKYSNIVRIVFVDMCRVRFNSELLNSSIGAIFLAQCLQKKLMHE